MKQFHNRRYIRRVIDKFKLPSDWHPGKGKTINDKGYVVFSRSRDSNSNRYEHRVVMAGALREWNPFGWTEIPSGFHVHHMDHVTVHNCRRNLVLIDAAIHDATSRIGSLRDPYTGRYLHRQEYERRYGSVGNDEVPF